MSTPFCDVAFVTVNYNTRPLVEDLISFFSRTELPFSHRLVVVDNASTDGSREMLERAEGIVYLQAGENLGYGRGVNRGLRAVESRYVCVMNTDLVLNRESLTALWDLFEKNPEAGVASPVIRTSSGRQQGFVFFRPSAAALYFDLVCRLMSKYWKVRVDLSRAPFRAPGVLGAFFMMRRSLIEGDTLFDEDFFFYYEDTDLSHRLLERGIVCYILPRVSIVHLGGQSSSPDASGALFHSSRRRYVEKHFGRARMERTRFFDRLRLRAKHLKYALLACVVKTERIKAKREYYANLARWDSESERGGRP